MIGKAEAANAVVAATAVASAPSIFGAYSIIAVGAIVGSYVAVSRGQNKSIKANIWFLSRAILLATVLTAAASKAIAGQIGWEQTDLLMPVSFAIAFFSDSLLSATDDLFGAAKSRLMKWMAQ